jgi:hypothetical protein
MMPEAIDSPIGGIFTSREGMEGEGRRRAREGKRERGRNASPKISHLGV